MLSDEATARGLRKAEEVFDELRRSGKSSEDIFVALYADLKQLARMKVSHQPPGASIHATRLLSDLYVRLFGNESADFQWESASHFFNTMALAMQQLLIDHARRFRSRGRDRMQSLDLDANGFRDPDGPPAREKNRNLSQERVEQALLIQELLERLEKDNVDEKNARIARRQAEIVRLRVFAGLTEDETAEILACSSETVTKEFRKARARLASYIRTRPS